MLQLADRDCHIHQNELGGRWPCHQAGSDLREGVSAAQRRARRARTSSRGVFSFNHLYVLRLSEQNLHANACMYSLLQGPCPAACQAIDDLDDAVALQPKDAALAEERAALIDRYHEQPGSRPRPSKQKPVAVRMPQPDADAAVRLTSAAVPAAPQSAQQETHAPSNKPKGHATAAVPKPAAAKSQKPAMHRDALAAGPMAVPAGGTEQTSAETAAQRLPTTSSPVTAAADCASVTIPVDSPPSTAPKSPAAMTASPAMTAAAVSSSAPQAAAAAVKAATPGQQMQQKPQQPSSPEVPSAAPHQNGHSNGHVSATNGTSQKQPAAKGSGPQLPSLSERLMPQLSRPTKGDILAHCQLQGCETSCDSILDISALGLHNETPAVAGASIRVLPQVDVVLTSVDIALEPSVPLLRLRRGLREDMAGADGPA